MNVKDLLLAPSLEPEQVGEILSPFGFKDPEKADQNLQAMADDPRARQLLAEILEVLLRCLSESADPDQALNFLERFSRAAVSKVQLFSYLKDSPYTLELLAKTFGGSPFMAEILIRDPLNLYWVSNPKILFRERRAAEMIRDLTASLRNLKDEKRKMDRVRTFRRREILRIGIRDLLRRAGVEETLAALSSLAEVLIQKTFEICLAGMRKEYGVFYHQGASGRRIRTGFTILGMGKLGGGELNFSSDVDLIYLYESDRGSASRSSKKGSHRLSANDYFGMLSRRITSFLSDATDEGYLYRVDLRLRPEGRMGEMAYSLNQSRKYYRLEAESWERLALLKVWPVGGDRALGMKFRSMVRSFIYHQPFNQKTQHEMRRIKERINQKIAVRGETSRNVKLGTGGIREIEFSVQALQVAYGKRHRKIRERNTMAALKKLLGQKLISQEEFQAFSLGYVFLRDIENKLQMVYDRQTHSMPEDKEKLRACAVRMGYKPRGGKGADEQLRKDYQFHTKRVNELFQSIFYPKKGSRFLK